MSVFENCQILMPQIFSDLQYFHNFQNFELQKFKSKNLQYAYKILTISGLNGQLSWIESKSEKLL